MSSALSYTSETELPAGTLVRVPLGRREVTGIVWDDADPPAVDGPDIELRPVSEALTALPPLTADWRRLAGFAAAYYQRGVGEVALSVLPPQLRQLTDAQVGRLRHYTERHLAIDNDRSTRSMIPALLG